MLPVPMPPTPMQPMVILLLGAEGRRGNDVGQAERRDGGGRGFQEVAAIHGAFMTGFLVGIALSSAIGMGICGELTHGFAPAAAGPLLPSGGEVFHNVREFCGHIMGLRPVVGKVVKLPRPALGGDQLPLAHADGAAAGGRPAQASGGRRAGRP